MGARGGVRCIAAGLVAAALACSSYGATAPDDAGAGAGDAGDGGDDSLAPDADAAATACTTAVEIDAGEDATCSGGTVDLASSPDDCGSCGRSCLGAMCSQGLCTPTSLHAEPCYLADLWGAELFWTAGSPLTGRAGALDGGPSRVVATIDGGPTGSDVLGLLADEASVYVNSHFGVFTGSREGGAPLSPIYPAPSTTSSLAEDSASVYWVVGSSVFRWPKGGGSGVETLVPGTSAITALVADGTDLFWLEDAGDGTSTLKRREGGTGTILVRTTGRAGARALISDGDALYWAEPQVILRASKTGSEPPQAIARWSGSPLVQAIAVVTERLYWVASTIDSSANDRNLYVAPVCGGRVRKLAHDRLIFGSLRSDGTWLYYCDGAWGVARLAL
jgi:hypothetical protein